MELNENVQAVVDQVIGMAETHALVIDAEGIRDTVEQSVRLLCLALSEDEVVAACDAIKGRIAGNNRGSAQLATIQEWSQDARRCAYLEGWCLSETGEPGRTYQVLRVADPDAWEDMDRPPFQPFADDADAWLEVMLGGGPYHKKAREIIQATSPLAWEEMSRVSARLLRIADKLFGGASLTSNSIEVEGVIENLQRPSGMLKDVFLRLQAVGESMGLAIARGEDCTDRFDEDYAEVTRLLDAAPWLMHPDYGCVARGTTD